MDEREFRRQISAAWSAINSALGIGRAFINARSLNTDSVFQNIALDANSTYAEIFRAGLNRSNYNILLHDYAYFQFSHEGEASWRLGYYPNPWLTGVASAEATLEHWEALEELGALTHEEASDLISEMEYLGAVPPIRFEYSAGQYRELAHPAAHFHIGRHAANRWPCAITIGPTAFAMIIAKLYYPAAWAKCSTIEGAVVEECIEDKLAAVLDAVRVVHQFSDRERRSFHFGRHMVIGR